jgi:hypothetical protein
MEEVDMDGSESDQELTGNETDESEWASKVHEHVWNMFIFMFFTLFKSRYSAIHLELLILEVSGIRI